MKEMIRLGVKSLGIVILMSAFMGGVIVIQTNAAIDSPLIPAYTVGFTTRQSVILEFAPTIICLILAGIVGSSISSELGTMRITEQIDALDIMGVNSASFLILPKIIAAVIIFPILIMYSMATGLVGGWLACQSLDNISSQTYLMGLQWYWDPFYLQYALIKTAIFAFIITSVSACEGYHASGGTLEVGRSSTKAVIYSCMTILLTNYVITQLLLL